MAIIPFNGTADRFLGSMFEEIFDISYEVEMFPGESAHVSYDMRSPDTILLWGAQVLDYDPDDRLLLTITDVLGTEYGTVMVNEPVLFEALDPDSNTLDFQIENLGDRRLSVVMMFAEDEEGSAPFMDSDSPLVNTLIPIAVFAILLVVGVVVSLISVLVFLVDWKNSRATGRV